MDQNYYGKMIKHWSYTMDYETKEIIIRMVGESDQVSHIRICEKDSRSMMSWFDLAKHIGEEQ